MANKRVQATLYSAPDPRRVRPAWALTWRWKSSGDLVAGIQAKRKVPIVRSGREEAWSESAG